MNILTATEHFKTAETLKTAVTAKQAICRGEILTVSPKLTPLISDVSPVKELPHGFGALVLLELRRHLRSYTNTLFVCEADGGVYIIVPSLYPASSLVPAFFFENASPVLRLLRECDTGIYTLAPRTKPKTARISSIDPEFSERFFDFIGEIHEIFSCVELDVNSLCSEDRREYVLRQCARISNFTDCPIELSLGEALEAAREFPKLDYQLFTAFLLTALYSAKHQAEDRTAHITLGILSGSLLVEVNFRLYRKAPHYREFSRWEHMAYEKNMLFEHSVGKNILKIRFNPIRTDWSLLGIKQKTK